jgi:hypothetical protein
LAKYSFFKGQVFVDEGAYSPLLKKSENNMKWSVLLFLKQPQLTKKEKRNVQKQVQKQ